MVKGNYEQEGWIIGGKPEVVSFQEEEYFLEGVLLSVEEQQQKRLDQFLISQGARAGIRPKRRQEPLSGLQEATDELEDEHVEHEKVRH